MTILEKLQEMKIDKDANLLPENIKSGITVFGVNGSLEFTSSVNGKNTTSIQLNSPNVIFVNVTDNLVNKIIAPSTDTRLQVTYADLAAAISLTADKIKVGETILGITGTYSDAMKVYTSDLDLMNDSSNIEDGEVVKVVENNTTTYWLKENSTLIELIKNESN